MAAHSSQLPTHSLMFSIICKVSENALCPIIQVIHEDINNIHSWDTPPVTDLQIDFVLLLNPLSPSAQQAFGPSH